MMHDAYGAAMMAYKRTRCALMMRQQDDPRKKNSGKCQPPGARPNSGKHPLTKFPRRENLGLPFQDRLGNAIGGGAPTYLAGVAPGTFAARQLIMASISLLRAWAMFKRPVSFSRKVARDTRHESRRASR
jgi:hypothetical protein